MNPLLNTAWLRTMTLDELRDALSHRLRLARGGESDSNDARAFARHHADVAAGIQEEIDRREAGGPDAA